ncbi:MAG: hypothetical protein IKN88_08595 [Bacteroidales bacterium]|jgi:predicted  nucleic acid-binding Zn-ribbon protein|nr:hypothetical protein [Bacteroidales bacterium]MBQ4020975.1 hypothetical protein [Bacteroidales bacterium]MBR3527812.1 hypothetical protein [Bacteroidales bacterium]
MATKKANKAIVTPIDQSETFVSAVKSVTESDGVSMEEKLRTLYKIQQADTAIDKIHLLRGELPLEVQDLEDDIAGLHTRISNTQAEIKDAEKYISDLKAKIEECKVLVEKYEEQSKKVMNNREYESITRQIEFQQLEQEASEKHIRETNLLLAEKAALLDETRKALEGREIDLSNKKAELEQIITETAKEEEQLEAHKEDLAKKIDERMYVAYNRVRNSCKNHLAVVTVKRGACGGCFNQIPPQRQLDIAQNKKIIICEYCGRILVSPEFDETAKEVKE